jgi:hypothetical protein
MQKILIFAVRKELYKCDARNPENSIQKTFTVQKE